jgi:ribosome biogenesis protein ENP2
MEEPEQQNDDSDSDRLSGDSDSEDDIVSKIRKERGLQVRDKHQSKQKTLRTGGKPVKKREMRMGTAGGKMTSRNETKKSFGSRLQSENNRRKNEGHKMSRTGLGGMEMTFTPKSGKSKNQRGRRS